MVVRAQEFKSFGLARFNAIELLEQEGGKLNNQELYTLARISRGELRHDMVPRRQGRELTSGVTVMQDST